MVAPIELHPTANVRSIASRTRIRQCIPLDETMSSGRTARRLKDHSVKATTIERIVGDEEVCAVSVDRQTIAAIGRCWISYVKSVNLYVRIDREVEHVHCVARIHG